MGGTAMKLLSISAVGGAAILMFGCAAWVAADSDPNIYYKSQADADVALSQFDRDNPSCQLWSNWQSVCVKQADNTIVCGKSKRGSVKPSKPFCVVANGLEQPAYIDRVPNGGDSVARFCNKRELLRGVGGNASQVCSQFAANRPFAKIDLGYPPNRWCRKWVSVKRGANLMPHCAELALPKSCKNPSITGVGPIAANPRNHPDMAAGFVPDKSPITVLYCGF